MTQIPTLTTDRLTLRAWTGDDAEPLHHILGQEGVLRYFPSSDPPPLERVERFVARQLAHWEEHSFGWWAVELREQPQLLGWNGLQYLPDTDEIEIGYLLSRPFWGRGLATEGAWAALTWGYETLADLDRLVGIVHPDNLASQRVLEKLGLSSRIRTVYFGMDCYRYCTDRAAYSARLAAQAAMTRE